MPILIKKVYIKGEIETQIPVADVLELEAYRKKLAETYAVENQKPFDIDFVIQTDNFDEIRYNRQKRKPC